jgi:hypothetical protein
MGYSARERGIGKLVLWRAVDPRRRSPQNPRSMLLPPILPAELPLLPAHPAAASPPAPQSPAPQLPAPQLPPSQLPAPPPALPAAPQLPARQWPGTAAMPLARLSIAP